MYVEESSPNQRVMDPRVDEATVALKGLLGIGGGTTLPTTTTSTTTSTLTTEASVPTSVPTTPTATNSNNNKSSNNPAPSSKSKSKKKKTKATAKNVNTVSATPTGTGKKAKARTANAVSKGASHRQEATTQPAEPQNFAWSAFQSSPDASKLPIPAFLHTAENARFGHAESSSPALLRPTLSYANAARTVAEKSEREGEPGPQTSHRKGDSPNPPDLANTVVEHQVTDAPLETFSTETITASTTNVPITPTAQVTEDPPISKTGINLAALASVTSPPTTSVRSPTLQSPPHPSPMHQHPHQPPVLFHTPPHPQSHPQPPAHALAHNPHRSPYPPHPHYGGPQHSPPFAPPGFVTIQVQVPSVLLPGRQMVVTSPAGYPVQITVPDHVPPGAILPVHVPNGLPLHMMPPPGPYPGGPFYPPHPYCG
jgi:hypothetical protein